MEREPCLWMQTGEDTEALRSNMVLNDDGEYVKHRFPQRGHQGDYDDKRPAQGIRFVYLVRHDGNVVAHTLTNGASHLDPTTPWGQYQMAQARSLGWYSPGQCPCALRDTGELPKRLLVSVEAKTGTPCASGTHGWVNPIDFSDNCPHSKAERAARLKRHAAAHEKMLAQSKNESTVALENQAKTIDLIAELVAAQSRGVAQPVTPIEPPPAKTDKAK